MLEMYKSATVARLKCIELNIVRKWVRGMDSDLIDVGKGQALAFKAKYKFQVIKGYVKVLQSRE